MLASTSVLFAEPLFIHMKLFRHSALIYTANLVCHMLKAVLRPALMMDTWLPKLVQRYGIRYCCQSCFLISYYKFYFYVSFSHLWNPIRLWRNPLGKLLYIAYIIGVDACGKVLYLILQPTLLVVPSAILQLYATDVEFKSCIVKCKNMLRPVM